MPTTVGQWAYVGLLLCKLQRHLVCVYMFLMTYSDATIMHAFDILETHRSVYVISYGLTVALFVESNGTCFV